MKNKVLIKIYVSSIDEDYDIYIPTNETVKKVLGLILKSVYELSDSNFDINTNHYLLDPESLTIYSNNQIIRETNINNSKKIVLV